MQCQTQCLQLGLAAITMLFQSHVLTLLQHIVPICLYECHKHLQCVVVSQSVSHPCLLSKCLLHLCACVGVCVCVCVFLQMLALSIAGVHLLGQIVAALPSTAIAMILLTPVCLSV